jgi:Stage II sporulation protein E (SpoIIE)/PAS fold
VPSAPDFAPAGALRAAYEAVDWTATPVGDPATWSAPLRTALDLALATRFPVALMWGPELVLLYNEAYVELIDDKHPASLGSSCVDVFPEAWDLIGPMFRSVLAGQGPTWVQDAHVPLHRRGFLEECYFTFSYSPVSDEDGTVLGVMDIAFETTDQVLDQRRLELLTRLGAALRDLPGSSHLPAVALPVLRSAVDDLPEVALHLPDDPAPVVDRAGWWRSSSAGLVLEVRLSEHLAVDHRYTGFLHLLADALVSAWSTATARELDARAAASSRSMSESLQRSLLTSPPQPDHLQIAVRYLPAAQDAQIGGDWYDAFLTQDGATCVSVGDVSGHDQQAAATMGQVRNLLRGIGYTLGDPPGVVLSALDRSLRDLGVGALATCVLATVEQDEHDAELGVRRLRWSSAGHLPPLVVHSDGSAELLVREPDLLLGLDPTVHRGDHVTVLEAGDTLLLYTDGLVERRDAALDEGLAWLVGAAAGWAGEDLETLCDSLLDAVRGAREDDVVVLAIRAHPQDRPRPVEAGPERLLADLAGP